LYFIHKGLVEAKGEREEEMKEGWRRSRAGEIGSAVRILGYAYSINFKNFTSNNQ
jgi:hypothetical protein